MAHVWQIRDVTRPTTGENAARAQAVAEAVLRRHHRRLWALPGTALGVVGWPPSLGERLFHRWHYWWQAHFLDASLTPRNGNRTIEIAG